MTRSPEGESETGSTSNQSPYRKVSRVDLGFLRALECYGVSAEQQAHVKTLDDQLQIQAHVARLKRQIANLDTARSSLMRTGFYFSILDCIKQLYAGLFQDSSTTTKVGYSRDELRQLYRHYMISFGDDLVDQLLDEQSVPLPPLKVLTQALERGVVSHTDFANPEAIRCLERHLWRAALQPATRRPSFIEVL